MAIGARDLPESPVRVYHQDDPRLAHTLAGRLQKEIADKSDQVVRGLAEDWADYKHRIGYIQGLKDTLRLANETEVELRGDRDARRTA